MQRPIFLFLTATLVLAASMPAHTQKFLPKTIQFKGDPEYSDQELMAAAGLKKGVVLNVDEMKSHSKMLMDTGVFDTLSFTFNGQDLVYKLVPSPTLFPIRLENLPLTPGKELDAKLHDRFPLYHGKVSSAGTLLEDVRGALEEMLASQGIKATVTSMPFGTPGTKNVTAMNFLIESPPVLVGTIQLDGVSPEMQSRVRSVADHQKGEPFDTENTEKNLEQIIESLYAEEGYAAVKVHANRSGDPAVALDAIDIPFSVVIQEGRIYKLGAIHLPPNSLVSQEEIDKAIRAYGKTTAKGQILRYTWFQIASSYKSKGYLDCAVKTQPEFDESTGTVSYTVDINPGPVYHLAFVKFENVSDDLRRLLMRSWQMLPGDPFDESYVSNFLVKAQKDDPALERTLATVKPTYDVLADPQTHDVNVVIRLEKRP
jgi:outer membrane protein assembly factor BamA